MIKVLINRYLFGFLIILLTLYFAYTQTPFLHLDDILIGPDSSVFIQQGFSLLRGERIYVDSFDHKGPIIFFINGCILFLIGGNIRFYGLFIFLNLIITQIFIFKILKLLSINKIKSFISLILFLILMSEVYEGGNLTEEYSLFPIIYIIYIQLKFIILNKHRLRDAAVISLMLIFLMLLKFNLAFIGISYIFILIIKRRFKDLLILLFSLSLFSCITYIYLNSIGVWHNFIDAYFIFNFKYISNGAFALDSYFVNLLSWIINNFLIGMLPILIVLFSSITKTSKKNKTLLLFLFLEYFIILTSADLALRGYKHYYIVIIPIVTMIYSLGFINKVKLKDYISVFLVIIFSFQSLILSPINRFKILESASNDTLEVIRILRGVKYSRLQVLGNNSSLYFLTDKTANTKFHYTAPILNISEDLSVEFLLLSQNREAQIIAFDKTINQIDLLNYLLSYAKYSLKFSNDKWDIYEVCE